MTGAFSVTWPWADLRNPVYGGTLPAQIWQQAMTNASGVG